MMLLAKSLTIIFLAANPQRIVPHAESMVMKQACGLITPESLEAKLLWFDVTMDRNNGFLRRDSCGENDATSEESGNDALLLAKGMMLLGMSLTMLLLAEIPPIVLRRARERRILQRDEKHCFSRRCDTPLPWEVAATTCLEAFFLVFLYLFE